MSSSTRSGRDKGNTEQPTFRENPPSPPQHTAPHHSGPGDPAEQSARPFRHAARARDPFEKTLTIDDEAATR
jgi:hypothetical protein